MILCLDVGNTQVFGGLFQNEKLAFTFRKSSLNFASSDEIGLFLRSVLRENGYDTNAVHHVAFCSVVPNLIYSLRMGILKYFHMEPFILQAGVKTGLRLMYKNPAEIGSDRIANAIAAVHERPQKDLIIVDLGTANTFCAISSDRSYLGGAITPGLRISMEALEAKTARLPKVEVLKPLQAVGRTTVESIQSGLYFGALGSIREIVGHIKKECFSQKPVMVIGTGGFSRLFEDADIFDEVMSDLVLQGVFLAWKMNTGDAEEV